MHDARSCPSHNRPARGSALGTYLFVSAAEPRSAVRAVRTFTAPLDLCVTSPSPAARKTAARVLDGGSVFSVEEPLLAGRVPGESSDDVIARYPQALRGLHAYETEFALVACDELRTLGDGVVVANGDKLMRIADELERELPKP